MCYRTLSASAVLLLIAGCATRDAQVIAPWQIEPVFNVRHAFQTSQAYYTLGRYHDGARAWGKAVDAYRKAIAADARHIEAYNALGVALAQMGHLADSETTLRQAVALAPALAHVRSNLGYVLLLAGKPQDAAIELQAAVRQDRGDATAAANLREAQVQVQVQSQAQSQTQSQAQARGSHAGSGAIAAVTPVQPTPVLSAGPIDTAPIAPMPDTAAAAAPGSAAASVSGSVTHAQAVAMPMPVSGQIATAAALRVFDQPNVASLQGSGTTRPDTTGGNPAPAGTARVAVVPDAGPGIGPGPGPNIMTLRAFELAATAAAAVAAPAAARDAVRVAMAPALIAATAVDTAPMARLEVSNGNGINGMAANLGRWLVLQGLKAARLTNQLPYNQQQTVVQYRSGFEQAALRVVRTLPTSATMEVARDLQTDVRVVLGRDSMQYAGCLAFQSCQGKAAAVALAGR